MKKLMGTTALILGIFLITLSFPFQSDAFLKGDVNDDERIDMVEAFNALRVISGLSSITATKTINVPADFQTIQEAIDTANPGDTINVAAGTYTESLRFSLKGGISLIGAGKDVTTIQGQSAEPKIKIWNSIGITIDGFLIKEGVSGIITYFSSVMVQNCRLENNQQYGIRVYNNSYGDLRNVSAKSNGLMGIRFNNGSTGWMGNCEASNNGTGISIDKAASAYSENLTATQNTGHGISIGNGDLFIQGEINASSNGGKGLNVSGGANVGIGVMCQANFSGNGSDGIGVYTNSTFSVIGNQSTLTISGNGGNGIQVGEMAKLSIDNISSCSISNNANGIDLSKNAIAWIAAPCTIFSNNLTGINVYANSILSLFGPQTEIYGNREHGIALWANSILERPFPSPPPLTITSNGGSGMGSGIQCGNPYPGPTTPIDTTSINFGSPSPSDPKYGVNTSGAMTGCGQ